MMTIDVSLATDEKNCDPVPITIGG